MDLLVGLGSSFGLRASLNTVQGRFCDAVKGNRPLSDALKVLEKTSSRHKAAIGAGTLGIVANIEASDELKEIRRWLGYDAVEPFQTRRINTLLNDCAKGTCSWLWRNREFAKFLEGCTKILSVEGKGGEFVESESIKLTSSLAGCGKSTTMYVATRVKYRWADNVHQRFGYKPSSDLPFTERIGMCGSCSFLRCGI